MTTIAEESQLRRHVFLTAFRENAEVIGRGLESKCFSVFHGIQNEIMALIEKREQELAALNREMSFHIGRVSHLFSRSDKLVREISNKDGNVRFLVTQKESQTIGQSIASVIAPETMAVERQIIIERYDPEIMRLINRRREVEENFDISEGNGFFRLSQLEAAQLNEDEMAKIDQWLREFCPQAASELTVKLADMV